MDQMAYLRQQGELQQKLAKAVAASLGGVRWEHARFTIACLGESGFVRILHRSGQQSATVPDAHDEVPIAQEMRRVSWTPHSGAWFSFEMTLDAATRAVETHTNWDKRFDEWITPPTDRAYTDDLLAFPRPWERIPDWHPARRIATERGWNEYLALRGLR